MQKIRILRFVLQPFPAHSRSLISTDPAVYLAKFVDKLQVFFGLKEAFFMHFPIDEKGVIFNRRLGPVEMLFRQHICSLASQQSDHAILRGGTYRSIKKL